MKQLRAIRIILAAICLAATAVCLIFSPQANPVVESVARIQILLSAGAATLGVTGVWLVITLIFGRVYCSTVCPIGVLSDIFCRMRRSIKPLNKPFRYRHKSNWGIRILVVYLLSIVIGISAVALIIEPWNMAANVASLARQDVIEPTWGEIMSHGVIAGMVCGALSLLMLIVSSLKYGREFCSRYCPIGAGLGYVQEFSVMHIEIDPDRCTSCGHCEDICRSQCVKVVSRYIDESRCVRCFDCVAECPTGAIRYQINRNRRPATPLMRQVKKTPNT